MEDVAANRLSQEQLDEDDPARIFAQTVGSELVKREQEEAEVAELQGPTKRARVQAATDVARVTLGYLEDGSSRE